MGFMGIINSKNRTMKILVFVGIFTAVNCQSGDVWGNCTICDYEKPTIEVLEFAVHGDKVKSWIDIDDDVWTTFLSEQPGYFSKGAYYPQDCDLSKSDHCLVSTVIHWSSLKLWKDITEDMMTDIYADMAQKSKDAGCEESEYPLVANQTKCWHFVKATRDYGFIEGAYHVLESSAKSTDILKVLLFSLFTVFWL